MSAPDMPGDEFFDDADERAAIQLADGCLMHLGPGDAPITNGVHAPAMPSPWGHLVTPAPDRWFTEKPEPRQWLLEDDRTDAGLFPAGKVGQLIGEGGVSKTLSLIQLTISVATGVPWLNTFDVPNPGRVLLAVGEEDADELHRRSWNARTVMRAPVPPAGSIVTLPLSGVTCAFLEKDEYGNLRETEFFGWFRNYVIDNGPWSLIILDPQSRFAGPDAEIDNAAATRFVQSLERIAGDAGASLIWSHHTNKLSRKGGEIEANAGRGSSALVDGARWQAALGAERLDDTDEIKVPEHLRRVITWAHTKSNYSRKADPLLLRPDLDHGGALVPLSDGEIDLVERVKAESGSGTGRMRKRAEASNAIRAEREAASDAKRKARDAEAERARQAKEAREEEARHARQAEQAEQTRGRERAQDDALRAIVGMQAGIGVVAVRAEMRARLGTCSNPTTDAAVARGRLAGWLEVQPNAGHRIKAKP
jgi:RecA-family ATPase